MAGKGKGKGSPIISVRLPHDVYAAVVADWAKRERHTTGESWDLSAWVRHAIIDTLAKRARSRKPRYQRKGKARPRKAPLPDQLADNGGKKA